MHTILFQNNAADIIQQKQPEVIGSLPPDCMEKLMNSDQIVESNAENAFKVISPNFSHSNNRSLKIWINSVEFQVLIIWAQQHQHRPNYLLLNTLRPQIKLLSLHVSTISCQILEFRLDNVSCRNIDFAF